MTTRHSRMGSLMACAILGGTIVASSGAQADSALDTLSGSWSGTGKATFEGGKSERLSCRAYYRGPRGENDHSFSIRCASASAKVELRASLSLKGSAVRGRWEERQHNATGALSGRVSSEAMRLDIKGSVSGGLSVILNGKNRHSVSLRSTGTALQSVDIGLRRT